MEWTQLFTIALGAILVNNFIVAQFLGICPFMGVSKKIETASGMGLAVIFVMGLASAICWPINELILVPMGLTFMQTVTYILVIASLVQFIEMFLKKAMPSLYEALGVYLPLITTNCAVLGVVLQNTQNGYGFIESVVYGVTGGIGFLLVIVIFASIRERMEFSEWPKAFEGFPHRPGGRRPHRSGFHGLLRPEGLRLRRAEEYDDCYDCRCGPGCAGRHLRPGPGDRLQGVRC